jgi:hypothetical protein
MPRDRSTPSPGSIARVLRSRARGGAARVMVFPAAAPPRSPRLRVRPWALLLLLLVPLALIPLLMGPNRGVAPVAPRGDARGGLATTAPPATLSPAAARYVAWATDVTGTPAVDSSIDRAVVAEGIRRLADALGEAMPGLDGRPAARLEAMRWHGELIARGDLLDPSVDYADAGHAHAALTHAAGLLGALAGSRTSLAAALAAEADAIAPRPLTVQGRPVRSFFRRAAVALMERSGR